MKLPLQAVNLQYVKAKPKENFLILSPYFLFKDNKSLFILRCKMNIEWIQMNKNRLAAIETYKFSNRLKKMSLLAGDNGTSEPSFMTTAPPFFLS